MVARGLMIAAVAVAVWACAAVAPDRASLQNAVYVVGDNTPLVKANAVSGPTESDGQFPVVKRLYWFFAGR